jgi:6-phosphofructokinase
MGAYAVKALLEGNSDVTVSVQGRNLVLVPYEKACFERDKDKELNRELYKLLKMLAS